MAAVELFPPRLSSYGQRVQTALTEKKIPFKLTIVDLGNKPQALLEVNPIHKKVPVIIHNGRPVAESLVILEYLETNFSAVGPFVLGDKFGLLDSVLAPFCSLQLVFKEVGGFVIPGPQELPRLNKRIDVVKVHRSVSSTLPPEEEPLMHVQEFLEKRAAMQ